MQAKYNYQQVLRKLKAKSRTDQLEGMASFGIAGENRWGVAVPELRKLAKEIGKNHKLALALWKTKIPDAMILASMVDNPAEVSEKQMELWVKDFNSWDVCDQVCMNLFDRVPFAFKKIREWASRKEEFVKRAAFALIASISCHDKNLPDSKFAELLLIIKKGSIDERNFVKKAVNWALRNIGKRNAHLNKIALKSAQEIQKIDTKAARWIAADAIRELESKAVQRRLAQKI